MARSNFKSSRVETDTVLSEFLVAQVQLESSKRDCPESLRSILSGGCTFGRLKLVAQETNFVGGGFDGEYLGTSSQV